MTGTGPFFEALAAGRGVVFAVPHSGNWDAAGLWVTETLRGMGREPVFTTVVQRLRPESLYRRFVAFREALGFEVVAAEDGSAAYRALTRRLRAGGVVCLVADRDVHVHRSRRLVLRRAGLVPHGTRPAGRAHRRRR